jgi:hypothetical protein
MLYDLQNDRKQNIDISNRPENAKLIEKYHEKLKVMREKVNKDPFK